jgi:glycine C-acetyltransferase
VRAAAVEAAGRWGVHAAGPLSRQGGSPPLAALEERIADMLCCSEATVFPTDWAASYGAIRVLVDPTDHVIIDVGANAALQEGAVAATRHVCKLDSFEPEAVADRLAEIRGENGHGGILVVALAFAPLDARVTDIASLCACCREFGATLLVEVTEDFGCIGDLGLGFLGAQAMVGEVDVVVGSLANSFAANGGFVAAAAPGIRQALAVFASTLTCSHAPSPVQAAAALAAFEIIRSAEGARRRARFMDNVLRLRAGLSARALAATGEAGTVVPVIFSGAAEARLLTREVLRRGALVDLVEHPDVPRASPRWILHVTADHTAEQLDRFVSITVSACDAIG